MGLSLILFQKSRRLPTWMATTTMRWVNWSWSSMATKENTGELSWLTVSTKASGDTADMNQ